ncbi:MAG: hypothetical protein ACLVAV_07340 [Clostridium sp.]
MGTGTHRAHYIVCKECFPKTLISVIKEENEAFLRRQFYVSEWWKKWKFRYQESRKHHIYHRCPNCKQKVRVPREEDGSSIHCPKCGTDFIKKS